MEHPPPAGNLPPPSPQNLSTQIYPTPTAQINAAAVTPPVTEPQKPVVKNPFVNMSKGFIKFFKTNFLLSILHTIIFGLMLLGVSGVVIYLLLDAVSLGYAFFGLESLLWSFVIILYMLVVSNLVLEGVRGHRVRIGQSFRPFKKIWVALIYAVAYAIISLLYFYFTLAALFADGSSATILLIEGITYLVVAYLGTVWAFGFFYILDYPDSGAFSSLRRSAALSKGHRLNIFCYYLVIVLIAAVTYFINGNSAFYPNGAVATANTVVSALAGLFIYAGLAELYRQLHDPAEPEPAATPVQAATPSPVPTVATPPPIMQTPEVPPTPVQPAPPVTPNAGPPAA